MHDDPATTTPPRITDPDDAHVGPDPLATAQPSAIGDGSSPHAWVCPFLRSIRDDWALAQPVEAPDPANRCAALHDAVPQSIRQQELVCLTSGHVNCPRYVRGSRLPAESLERVSDPQVVTPALAASVVVLAAAFLLSLAFVLVNGGLILTAAVTPPTPSGNVLAEEQTAAPTATPAPTVPASPAPTKKPAATVPPGATASRMKLLTPCPDTPKCYIYRIRSGDNLYSIAKYFGVSFSTVKAWNAWTDNGLKVGRELRIPPPTN